MTFATLAKRAEQLVVNNSPAILTGIGAAGALAAAYLTGRATVKAVQVVEAEKQAMLLTPQTPMRWQHQVQLCWKFYIPPAVTLGLTISAIVFANRIGTRRAAALAAAYAISEKALEEYKDKIVEKFGEKKEREARDELAQERVDRKFLYGEPDILVTGHGSALFLDGPSGRLFISDMETIRRAENDINHQILHDTFATHNDFYDRIDLAHTSLSGDMGWNDNKLLEIEYTATITKMGQPCIVLNYGLATHRNYHRLQ